MSNATMKIPFRGKTYEVRRASDPSQCEVWLDGVRVGGFVLGDDPDDVRVTLEGKTTRETILGVANEFVDRGGAPMGIA